MRKFYLSLSALLLALSASAQSTLPQPMVGKATNISSDGFTANWKPVPKADGYCVFVYTQTPVMADGEHLWMERLRPSHIRKRNGGRISLFTLPRPSGQRREI